MEHPQFYPRKFMQMLLLLLASTVFKSKAQTLSRQDSLVIVNGIQMQAWASTGQPPLYSTFINKKLVIGRTGRYVRLQLPNTETIHLAEMQIFSGGTNIALGKPTVQSSNGTAATVSSLAVDGNTNGILANGSVAQTATGYSEMEPWWEVDLGAVSTIDSIKIWNRTDNSTMQIKGFYLFVSDTAFASTSVLATLRQPGVSQYYEAQSTNPLSLLNAASLQDANITSTILIDPPFYNYEVHEQDPSLHWGLAQRVGRDMQTNVVRSPSAFELSNGFLNSIQANNIGKCISICIGDEDLYTTSRVQLWKSWFDLIKSKYPNVLVHNNQNQSNVKWTDTQLRSYMAGAQPDLITYDWYCFSAGRTPAAGNSYAVIMDQLSRYRNLALAGNDGTGQTPILFGGYLQGYKGAVGGVSYKYTPSESETNINFYSHLLMGAKWLCIFRYLDNDVAVFFWTWNGVQLPQFRHFANIGRELKHLSPHLSRLQSTDVRIIPGQHLVNGAPVSNTRPAGIAAWTPSADPYIVNIEATNMVSSNNDGLRGDVALGYFKPVEGLATASGITMAPVPSANTNYFMLMNGLAKPNGCCHVAGDPALTTDTIAGNADLAIQKITLTIDFGTRPVDTLYRVRRADGIVEMVPLTLVSGSQYVMHDTLEGGKADLFYWKNAALLPGHSVNLTAGSIQANVTELKNASKFTIEKWVRLNSSTTYNKIINRGANPYQILVEVNPTLGANVTVRNGATTYGSTPAGTFALNQWYHIALVFDGTQSTNANKLKFYVNGVQKTLSFTTGNLPSTTPNTDASLAINNHNGTVDEIRVWKTNLSGATITAWKDKKLGSCHPNAANLVVYWPLDTIYNPLEALPALGTAYTGTLTSGSYTSGTQAEGESGCAFAPPALSASNFREPAKTGDTDNVTVYPNPVFAGTLHIHIKSTKKYRGAFSISDLNGKTVSSAVKEISNGMNMLSFDVSGLTPGIYFLQLRSPSGETEVHKFIRM